MLGGALPGEWRIYLLAFRGTVDLKDWITNLGVRVNWGPFANLMLGVHSGWHAAVSEESLHQKLKTAAAGLDHDQVLLAGHSMGAALAQMAMLFMWLESQSGESPLYGSKLVKTARCVIFGSPAPFVHNTDRNVSAQQRGRKARAWMETQCVNFINGEDPVPRLPFNFTFCVSWLASFGLELPENVNSELQSYEHFCRHIILGHEETTFSFCEPADDAVRREEAGGRGKSSHHPLDNYSAEMLGKLQVALAADSKPLLRMVSYRPKAKKPDLGQSLSMLQTSLSDLPPDAREDWKSPFGTIFASIQQVSISLQNLQSSMELLGENCLEVQRLHNLVRKDLECIAGYTRAANNDIQRDDWKSFGLTMVYIQSMMKEDVLPHVDRLAEAIALASSKCELATGTLTQVQGLVKTLGVVTRGMGRAAIAVAGFVSTCLQLGVEYPTIATLLNILAIGLGAGAVLAFSGALASGVPVAAFAHMTLCGVSFPSCLVICVFSNAFSASLAYCDERAVVNAWRLLLGRLLELAQMIGVGPLVEVLHWIATACAHLGHRGYDAFMSALLWFYDRAHEWAMWLQEELEQLKHFLETVGEKLKEAQGNCETVRQEMKKVQCKTREIASMVGFVADQGRSPEEIEQKKQECRDMTQEMLNETAEIEGRLGHGFALDWDPMVAQSFTQAVEDFFSSSTNEALQLRDEPASSSHEAGR